MNVEDKQILVVGDIMLDKYVVTSVERISPEAPVPVCKVINEYSTLGGCGNVVRNLRSIGVKTVCLASVGEDYEGDDIINHLDDINAEPLVIRESKRTIVKERIVANSRMTQMLRIDREEIQDVNFNKLIYPLSLYLEHNKIDLILISDYAKGVITPQLMNFLKRTKIDIIVDPKPQNAPLYEDVYMITPNEKEYSLMQYIMLHTINYILITKGSKGMELINHDKTWDIPVEQVEVYNVSGAGDTVLAVVGACHTLGLSPLDSAKIANQCAAHVVTKPGTTPVSKKIFEESLYNFK